MYRPAPYAVSIRQAARASFVTLSQSLYIIQLFFFFLIYLFHLFTQGKPKQLTLIFIGALHTFHIVTYMYVQCKHNTIQSNLREHDAYQNSTCIISHNQACTVMGTNVFRSSRLNEFKQVMVRNCGGKSFHMFAPLTAKLVA